MTQRRSFFVGVGSNVEAEQNVRLALLELRTMFPDLTRSSLYESDAVGFNGDPFINLVVQASTTASIDVVCDVLGNIETLCGRQRGEKRFAPRTLDLDLLTWGDKPLKRGRLVLPRDEILEYAFVLRPLAELAPTSVHPVDGRSYAELWETLGPEMPAIKKLDLDF